jgi:hypothetical protein
VGSTKTEAVNSLKDCLNSTIEYCIKKGTLLQALEQEGFSEQMTLPKATKERSFKALNYNIH